MQPIAKLAQTSKCVCTPSSVKNEGAAVSVLLLQVDYLCSHKRKIVREVP